MAIEETNDSYDNSEIFEELLLANVVRVNYTEATGGTASENIVTDLNRFRNGNDGFMDEVHTLRDLYDADICVLIADNSNWSSFAGRAFTIHSDNNDDEAFCIADWNNATGNFTFGHEIGHLQGARHDNDTNTNPFTYGHGFVDPASNWRTIMAVFNSTIPRIQFWSNPNVDHPIDATPMGTANFNDNARVLNGETQNMADYRNLASSLNIAGTDISLENNEEAMIEASGAIVVNGNNSNFSNASRLELSALNSITINGEINIEAGCELVIDNEVDDCID